jgi:hypothetical protein
MNGCLKAQTPRSRLRLDVGRKAVIPTANDMRPAPQKADFTANPQISHFFLGIQRQHKQQLCRINFPYYRMNPSMLVFPNSFLPSLYPLERAYALRCYVVVTSKLPVAFISSTVFLGACVCATLSCVVVISKLFSIVRSLPQLYFFQG